MSLESNDSKQSSVLESQERYDKYRNDWNKYNDGVYLNNLKLLNTANLTLYKFDIRDYILKDAVSIKKLTTPGVEEDDVANDNFARLIMLLPDPHIEDCLSINSKINNKIHLNIKQTAKYELIELDMPYLDKDIDEYISYQKEQPVKIGFISNTLESLMFFGDNSYEINLGKYIGLMSDFEIENNKSILDIELIAVALSNGVTINPKSLRYWSNKINSAHCCQGLINCFDDYKNQQKYKAIDYKIAEELHQILVEFGLITGEFGECIWHGKSRELYRYLAMKLTEHKIIPKIKGVHWLDILNAYIPIEKISNMKSRGMTFSSISGMPIGYKEVDKLIKKLIK